MAEGLAEAKRQTLSALREVAQLAEDTGATTLARKLHEGRIPRLEDERFHLVVLGEFNHGKSTFVNALLGASVLPTGVTPTTGIIHHLSWGEQPSAEAVMEDGARQPVPVEGLDEYVTGGRAAEQGVHRIEVTYPAPMLEGGVVLVDTPGVNDLGEARAEITYGYIPQADAVLLLLDAGQILKESERAFVGNKLLSASRDKVLFVVNKVDLLSEQERGEALQYAHQHVTDLVSSPQVYGVSARGALEGQRAASGIDAFTRDLEAFLRGERGRVLLDNALDEGLRAAGTLRNGLQVQRRALGMEQEELGRRLQALEADLEASEETLAKRTQQVREEVAAVKAVARQDCDAFAERFASALPSEIESAEAKDLRRYLASFIEDRFREFAEQEGEIIARKLEKVAEDAIAFVAEDAGARARQLEEALGPAAPKLNLNVNTFAYDVGVFAVGAFGVTMMALSNVLVGGAMTLAAPMLAWLVRGRVDKQVRQQAAEEAPHVVREAAGKMAEAFEARIDEFGERIVEFVTQANRETTQSLAEVVRYARDAHARGEEERERLETHASDALGRLDDAEQRMRRLRDALHRGGE